MTQLSGPHLSSMCQLPIGATGSTLVIYGINFVASLLIGKSICLSAQMAEWHMAPRATCWTIFNRPGLDPKFSSFNSWPKIIFLEDVDIFHVKRLVFGFTSATEKIHPDKGREEAQKEERRVNRLVTWEGWCSLLSLNCHCQLYSHLPGINKPRFHFTDWCFLRALDGGAFVWNRTWGQTFNKGKTMMNKEDKFRAAMLPAGIPLSAPTSPPNQPALKSSKMLFLTMALGRYLKLWINGGYVFIVCNSGSVERPQVRWGLQCSRYRTFTK